MSNVNIFLASKLDITKSIEQINKDIPKLEGQLKNLKLKVSIDNELFKNITTQMKQLNNSLNLNLGGGSISSDLEKLAVTTKKVAGEQEILSKVVKDVKISAHETARVIDNYDTTTQKVSSTTETVITNYKKQRDEQKSLIGTFEQLKSSNLQANDVAKVLSSQYGDLQVRSHSLDQITGKYTVTLRQNAKENLVLKGSVDQVTGALRVQNQTVQQARNVQLGFFEQLKIALARVPIWLGATTVYFQSMRFGSQLIQDISEINQSMVMLERVSNATKEELDEFRKTSPRIASSLGVLNQEVQTTTAEIVRLGYSLQDAEELMKLSSVMKTVGSLRDIGDATDYLISIMKAFKVEVGGATEIVDYLNHVANTSSINMTALGEGLLRMSSAMSEANNSVEESVGLLVSGFDITRDAEKTATALRTISIIWYFVALCSNAH